MTEKEWKWEGGRLVSTDGFSSLSIGQAYHRIPESAEIARACHNVLIPYSRYHDGLKT